eukprot:scaffold2003_cov139-Cylindrotheca_fusiformis.AAC.2
MSISFCEAFLSNIPSYSSTLQMSMVHTLRDADFYEMLVGGERYEMVPMPDSMLDTTLFVGNLNEFVNDQDLSDYFCRVTQLSSVPACVARKANMNSLSYGFVTFPSKLEKEMAILKFHNSMFKGKPLKVEEIRDHPKKGRVKVPERMVAYVIGDVKRTPSREVNTMRQVSNPSTSSNNINSKRKRSLKKKKQPKAAAAAGSASLARKLQRYRLTESEQASLQRAIRNGFVTLDGTGFRRGRKTCTLACAHRHWCDGSTERKPQIILCKASGGRPLDCVIVDLSPLRRKDNRYEAFGQQIAQAALRAGMTLRQDYQEDNCQTSLTPQQLEWSIAKLPTLSMGVYEGERSQARAMARELATLWDIPSDQEDELVVQQKDAKKLRDKKQKRRNQRRQELDFFF